MGTIYWYIVSKNSTLVKAKQIDNIGNDKMHMSNTFLF